MHPSVPADLQRLTLPLARLGEAVAALAQQAGLSAHTHDVAAPAAALRDDAALNAWIDAAAASLGIEAEPIQATYAEAGELVRRAAPALLRIGDGSDARFLLLVRGGRRRVAVLDPDGAVHRVETALIIALLRAPLEHTHAAETDELLAAIRLPAARRTRARAALLGERLSGAPITGCWRLRLPPGAPFVQQMRRAGVLRYLATFVAAHFVNVLLWAGSWWLVGRTLLNGRLDWNWLLGWVLVLLALIPFQMLARWAEGQFAIRTGMLLKQRLLHGALRLHPDEVRHQGVGQFLGRVIESDAVEYLALGGGLNSLLALIDLLVAGVVLASGAGGTFHALLLAGWMLLTVLLVWRFYVARRRWTAARLRMTHDMTEQMVGHRTILAQQRPDRLHAEQNRALQEYKCLSQPMDRLTALLIALVPRGWLLVSLLTLAGAFLAGSAPTALAVGLGGTLLAWQALTRFFLGVGYLSNAFIAWQQVAPLFHAAAREEALTCSTHALPLPLDGQGLHGEDVPLLAAHNLSYRYHEHGATVLTGCDLHIAHGDKLLLQGVSGGGKTTLAALLAGLRAPAGGLLLLHGLDRQTLGAAGWRRFVAAAPQFHENHVLTETFAFNLLMGRRGAWTQSDLDEAETLCRELGLGDLLDRMPAGMLQLVGETGWQLSHGERSRVYLARALLQRADLVILDESFAALDPETLHSALRCALQRAPTLLVIAHP